MTADAIRTELRMRRPFRLRTADGMTVSVPPNDLRIASHALTYHVTLVTSNLRDFARTDGLKIENWLG